MRIAIVGFGIVGAYIAWKLKEKGFEPEVFERQKQPGKEACSGLISDRIWNFFPKNRVKNEDKSFSLYLHSSKSAEKTCVHEWNNVDEQLIKNKIEFVNIFYKKPVQVKFKRKLLVFDRPELDKYAGKLAEEAGVKVNYNCPVEKIIHIKNSKPQLLAGGKWEEFDKIIGADGANSVVRNSLGIKPPKFRLGIFGIIGKPNNNNFVDTYPTENGFKWKIPRGEKIEYGVLEDLKKAKLIFEEFCKEKRIRPKQVYSALVPEGLITTGLENIALCGDAAGLTKRWSGGGVIWGLTAAKFLTESFPDLRKYEKNLKGFFGPKLFKNRLVTGIVKEAGEAGIIPSGLKFDPDWGI